MTSVFSVVVDFRVMYSIFKVFLEYVCLLLSNNWLCVDVLRARARVYICERVIVGNSLYVTHL